MSEMVERVARAIAPDVWINFDAFCRLKEYKIDEVEDRKRTSEAIKLSIKRARAAIEAMREPTEAMLTAGSMRTGEAYAAMIEAALKEKQDG